MDVLQSLLGLYADSEDISTCLTRLSGSDSTPKHELKAYSDVVYYNYLTLGLSLLFSPIEGYIPKVRASEGDINLRKLSLTGIDVYNRIETAADPTDNKSGTSKPKIVNEQYSPYPAYPITLTLPPTPIEGISSSSSTTTAATKTLTITPDSTGKTFVEALGEPSRKGGGTGPSSGSINIWCEWSPLGLMVEFGGNEARGPQAWERGKDARWSVISIFQSPNAKT